MVCRQLGFESAQQALSNAYFGEGDDSMPIWLDDVECYGSEATITECLYGEFGQHNCRHNQDAGVRCYRKDSVIWYDVMITSCLRMTSAYVFHMTLWS